MNSSEAYEAPTAEAATVASTAERQNAMMIFGISKANALISLN